MPYIDTTGNLQNVTGSWAERRQRTMGVKPYVLPNPYAFYRGEVVSTVPGDLEDSFACYVKPDGISGVEHNVFSPWRVVGSSLQENAVNKALSSFKDSLGESAEMAVNWAERQQSINMIAKRSSQMYRAAKAIRSFRFGDLNDVFREATGRSKNFTRISRADQKRNLAKATSDLWLEWHFGAEPLIKDVRNAMSAVIDPNLLGKIVGRGHVKDVLSYTTTHTYTKAVSDHNMSIRASVNAYVKVSSPELYMANRLGFLNPLGIAWELVPFSFVIDWFVNVSDVLKDINPYAGLEITRASYTVKTVDNLRTQGFRRPFTWASWVAETDVNRRSVSLVRTMGLPSVQLHVRPPWSFSPTRGLTAIALLVQQGLKPLAVQMRTGKVPGLQSRRFHIWTDLHEKY